MEMGGKLTLLAYRALLLSSVILLFIGLILFLTPFVYVLQNGSGYLTQYPNWRGLLFVVAGVVVSMTGAIVLRSDQLGKSIVTGSLGLLIAGFISMVLGLFWLFTPRVDLSGGDSNLIEYSNANGLPLTSGSPRSFGLEMVGFCGARVWRTHASPPRSVSLWPVSSVSSSESSSSS